MQLQPIQSHVCNAASYVLQQLLAVCLMSFEACFVLVVDLVMHIIVKP